MAYFDVDDPIRKQLAEKYESSGKGPTITVDAVTGETSLGAKKNPTAKDWRDSYENYMRQGGSPLTAPVGMSATRMYQHAIFKGRGMSYYSSEPFESTGFLGEIQQDIAPEAEDEGVVSDSTPTPYIPKIRPSEPGDEENPYDTIPDPGYATGYGTTLAGPEVDLGKTLYSDRNINRPNLFDTKIPGFTGIALKAFEMLFGDHPSAKESKKMFEEINKDAGPSVFTPPDTTNLFKYDPNKNWGDIEGGATPGLPGYGGGGSYTGWDAWANAVNQETKPSRYTEYNPGLWGGDEDAPPSAPTDPTTGLYGTEPGTEYGQPQADTNWGDEDTPGDGGGLGSGDDIGDVTEDTSGDVAGI